MEAAWINSHATRPGVRVRHKANLPVNQNEVC